MKKVRIKWDGRYYDAVLDGDVAIPMWETLKNGDIIAIHGIDLKWKSIHIVKCVHPNGECGMYVTKLGNSNLFLVSEEGEIRNCVEAPRVRKVTEEEKQELFDELKKEGYRWDEENLKLEKLKE